MRTYLWLGTVSLLLASLARPAQAWEWPPVKIDAGAKAWFNVYFPGSPGYPIVERGPWYLYFPHEAHFQAPVPVGGQYPHWPTHAHPSALPGAPAPAADQPRNITPPETPLPPLNLNPGAAPPTSAPANTPVMFYGQHNAGYQPGTHFFQAPSYWYGR